MKKFLIVLLAVGMVLCLFTACSSLSTSAGSAAASASTGASAPESASVSEAVGTETTATASSGSSDVFKVAWLLNASDNWHHQCSVIGQKYMEENGSNIEVTILDTKGDEAQLTNLLEQVQLEEDYDLALFATLTDRSDAVKALQEAGTNVICYAIDNEWQHGLCSTYQCGEYNLGNQVALKAMAEIPQGSGIVVLRGYEGYSGSVQRGQGFQDAIATRSDVIVIDEKYCNFDKGKAMAMMDDWITAHGDEIQCVLSENDAMALGAIEALKTAGMSTDDVYVYGIDGLYEGCQAIKEGTIRVSGYQDCEEYAKAFLERINKLQSGEADSTYTEDYTFEPVMIDSSNVQAYIDYYTQLGLNA